MILRFNVVLALVGRKRTLRHVGEVLFRGLVLHEVGSEDYSWKRPGCYRVTGHVVLSEPDRPAAVYRVLEIATGMARGTWTFDGPFAGNDLILSCILNNAELDRPVRWACLELAAAPGMSQAG